MGLFSGASSSTVHYATWGALADAMGKVVKQWAENRRTNHQAHVDLFRRLTQKHNGHVQAWEAWKVKPWTWRNHLAAAINAFIRWTERDD